MTPARGALAATVLLSLAACADEYATVESRGGGIHDIRMEECRQAGLDEPVVQERVRSHIATVADGVCREGYDVLEQAVDSGMFGNAVVGECRTVKLDARIQCKENMR